MIGNDQKPSALSTIHIKLESENLEDKNLLIWCVFFE